MISHDYKCIFIHIPRTGGTSIEHAVFGGNWWSIDKKTKHITASQAKKFYAEYWDSYFKFSFVRNPFDRAISLLNFSEMYYGSKESQILTLNHIDWYKQRFGAPYTVEYDHRFYERSDVIKETHAPNQVYGNIIDEEIDFVGKFENLQDDVDFVYEKLGIKKKVVPHAAKSAKLSSDKRSHYESLAIKRLVAELYYNDFKQFGYDLND